MAKKINISYVVAIVVLALAVVIGIGGTLTGNTVEGRISSGGNCYDNDAFRGGDEYFRGTITLTNNDGEELVYEDVCGADDSHLIQYSCLRETSFTTSSIWCENGCLEGVCIN